MSKIIATSGYEIINAEISSIRPHRLNKCFSRITSMKESLFLPSSLPNLDVLENILMLQPILAANAGKDRYYCIGGLRSYALAKALLDPNDMVPVHFYHRIRSTKIDQLISDDAFLLKLLFTSKHKCDIGDIFMGTPEAQIERLFGIKSKSKRDFAKLLKVPYNSLFPKEKPSDAK